MQPTIVITAPVPGMIYLNGRFAGEAGPDRALMSPVSPYGALYAEYRPLAPGQRAAAFKCVFSAGRLIADSIADARSISAIQWPGNILEIEIRSPEKYSEHFMLGDKPCTLEYSRGMRMVWAGLEIPLPDRALRPSLISLHGIPALKGDIEHRGQYLITLSRGLAVQTGVLTADHIDAGDGDILHAMVSFNDTVGHGRLEQWLVDDDGLKRLSSEPVWPSGGPSWPQTAEDTMIAAVEAALQGLFGEADNYFTPSLGDTSPLNAISDVCDLCLPMKYGIPDQRPCIGLLHMENECFATVAPLWYRAHLAGGPQGAWQIEWISLE